MIRRGVWILLAMVLVLLATAVLVPASETGSRWLLRQGLALVPGKVDFADTRGSLWSGLGISQLEYRRDGVRVRLEQARFEPDWSALLRGTFSIKALILERLRIEVPAPAAATSEPESGLPAAAHWPAVTLPLPLRIERLEVRTVVLQRGQEQHELTRVALAGNGAGRTLDLRYLAVQQQARHLTWRGTVKLAPPWRLDGRLAWGFPLAPDLAATFGHPTAAGEARVQGPVDRLSLEHQLHYPQSVHSTGELRPLARPLEHRLTHEWQHLRVTPPGGPALTLGPGELESRGAPGAYRLKLAAGISQVPGLPPVQPRLRARGDGDGLAIDELRLASDNGTLSASGALDWSGTPSWTLSIEGNAIDPSWLHEQARGKLNFAGHMNGRLPADAPLELNLELTRFAGRLHGEPLSGSARVSLAGVDGARIHSLRLDSRHGRLRIRGQVDWAPRLQWDLALEGQDLDPALLWPQWPGRLALAGTFAGALPPDKPVELDLVLDSLGGALRGRAVGGGGELHLRGTRNVQANLKLTLADNTLHVRGHRDGDTELNLTVAAPELGALGPQLAGRLNGEIRVHGPAAEPRLDGHLTGSDLRLRELKLAAATLTLASTDQAQRLNLRAGPLRGREKQLIDELALNARGRLAEHQLNWRLQRAEHTLSGILTGGRENGHWQGRLQGVELDGSLTGLWRQAEPARVRLAGSSARIEPLCLQADPGPGRLCGGASWHGAGAADAHWSLTAVPLAPLAAALPAGARVVGRVTGNGKLQLRNGEPSGQVQLTSDSGALLLAANREDPVRLPWHNWAARGRLTGGDWQARTHVKGSDGDFLDARIERRSGQHGPELEGRLDLRVTRIAWLELLVPRLRAPEGRLEGSLSLAGTPEQPVFDGELGLKEASVQVPRAGIVLRDLQLLARADASGVLRLDGRARSGEGEVRLAGQLQTDQAWPWPLRLTLRGERVLVYDAPDGRVWLNPDLELTLTGDRIRLGGTIRVPEARLRPRELPTRAVSVSRDVQLAHSEPEQESPFKLAIDVGLELGDQVHFQGFGLEARFTGTVQYRDPVDQVPRMTGRLSIAQGRYRAYGQHLRIERGHLLFEGAPANPGLDIVAIRPLPDRETRVGLEVTGTLQQPRARVFSEPPLEDTEVMALLLTGQPLSGTSRMENEAILQAISRYGLEKGSFLADPLSESLGVEVGVDASGTNEQTALTLGKQLSERLYVRYSVGIFESLSTVMLRYSITPRLSLETRSSGQSQGADLIYRLQAN